MTEWLDREQALALLGVKPQTLYAYVSRARIEVRQSPDNARASLYRAADVEALAARHGRSRKPSVIAAGSMAWGEPSIVTTISTIDRARLIYRGQDAVALADGATLEQVAQLLWDSAEAVVFLSPSPSGEREGVGVVNARKLSIVEDEPTPHPNPSPEGEGLLPDQIASPFQALARLAGTSEATFGRGRERLCREAVTAICALAATCGLRPGFPALHLALANAWKLGPEATDLIRRALVLMADHELNPSTFATRVAAATGAPIAASLLAGLCAFSGPIHGGAAAALDRLVGEAETTTPQRAVQAWLDRYGLLPGFGHALYPKGDARALALMAHLTPDPLLAAVQDAVFDLTGLPPNIDFALTTLARTQTLPANAPFTIFLLGRSVGWAAHAMEQVQSGALIRPRAVYEGVGLGDS